MNKQSLQPLPSKSSKKTFSITIDKNIIIPVLIFITVFVFLAGATKAGYFPNVFEIGFLCPEKDTTKNQQWQKSVNTSTAPASVNNTTNNVNNNIDPDEILWDKPVIYLYPENPTQVLVQLFYNGKIVADFPDYNNDIHGWRVFAYPDGTLINEEDGQKYNYLFWEGLPSESVDYDLSSGFVVKGGDVKKFLQEKLSQIGLTPREYNEFIVYWYPKMMNNKYNLIHFAQEEYTDIAKLNIEPEPDSELRVFMAYKRLEEPVEIKEQELAFFQREGFVVVEWGGTEIK